MNNCSIITQIKRAEENIKLCYEKVTNLENALNTKSLPSDKKKSLVEELKEIRKLIATNEEHLSKLHGENRRSFALASSLFFLIFLLYGIYIMIMGQEL